MYFKTVKKIAITAGLLALINAAAVDFSNNGVDRRAFNVNTFAPAIHNFALTKRQATECPIIINEFTVNDADPSGFGYITFDPNNIIPIPPTSDGFTISFNIDSSTDIKFIISNSATSQSEVALVGEINVTNNNPWYIGGETLSPPVVAAAMAVLAVDPIVKVTISMDANGRVTLSRNGVEQSYTLPDEYNAQEFNSANGYSLFLGTLEGTTILQNVSVEVAGGVCPEESSSEETTPEETTPEETTPEETTPEETTPEETTPGETTPEETTPEETTPEETTPEETTPEETTPEETTPEETTPEETTPEETTPEETTPEETTPEETTPEETTPEETTPEETTPEETTPEETTPEETTPEETTPEETTPEE
ncbi:Proteoglycan 4, partial [Smittium culicis]